MPFAPLGAGDSSHAHSLTKAEERKERGASANFSDLFQKMDAGCSGAGSLEKLEKARKQRATAAKYWHGGGIDMKMLRLDQQIRAQKEKEKAASSGGDSAPKITIGNLAGFAAKTPV